ncbi:MAG: hypothetical protein CMK32_09200 [Porticoccaceae bacterium]|nr:hypothetical protein [Porticoccaceae bacterium]
MQLTARQRQVLDLISATMHETGSPPTRAEIAAALGFKSANAAEEHLRALARKGAIEIIPGTSRGIRLHTRPNGLPIVGRVAAGEPILATEHIEDYIDVSANLFSPQADYLLRVRGDSMEDAGINDGDLLAVHRTASAEHGQTVVARLDDEVTVKVLDRSGMKHLIRLLPRNPAYAPIEVDLRQQSLVIEGLGVGVIRQRLGSRVG